MTKPTWILQVNLGNPLDFVSLKESLIKEKTHYQRVRIIPFSGDLPDLPEKGPYVFYGSVGFIKSIQSHPQWGKYLFTNDNFRFSCWSTKYFREDLLNGDAELTTMKEFSQRELPEDQKFVFRPDQDPKDFSGRVLPFGEFRDWCQRLEAENCLLKTDTSILVAQPKDVIKEWRLFICNGRPIAACQYRENGGKVSVEGCPREISDFAYHLCTRWVPHELFVMDVALSLDGIQLIEIKGFHSSGFYSCNVHEIVKSTNSLFSRVI